jgi:N-methylhydantoinase B/oxoprolinase/acetone carboxylase alpha subunit
LQTPGGGGYGPASQRRSEARLHDLQQGFVTSPTGKERS